MMANQLYTKGRLLLCMVIIWIAGLAAESRIGMPEVAAAGNDSRDGFRMTQVF